MEWLDKRAQGRVWVVKSVLSFFFVSFLSYWLPLFISFQRATLHLAILVRCRLSEIYFSSLLLEALLNAAVLASEVVILTVDWSSATVDPSLAANDIRGGVVIKMMN